MTAIKTLRELNKDDRAKALNEARDELMHERGLAAMGGAVKNPGKIRELRRTIARILTLNTQGTSQVKAPVVAAKPKAAATTKKPKTATARKTAKRGAEK
ncbi:MAG: 50S ribosomal protein L29 [Euryarchaeota archaeon]|nr:50S ribosomal protein L29 [Euryarchaeota archaeon]